MNASREPGQYTKVPADPAFFPGVLAEAMQWLAFLPGLACLLFVSVVLGIHGSATFEVHLFDGDRIAPSGIGHELGTVPALLAAAGFLMAHGRARERRHRAAALWFAAALQVLVLLTAIPRGVDSTWWMLQPLLTVLVAVMLGVRPGLCTALVGASAVLAAAALQGAGHLATSELGGRWSVAATEAAVILGSGVVGGLVHASLQRALHAELDQRMRLAETLEILAERERLLAHAMRVTTLGEMAGMVVHQLRNQFQLMMGVAALGQREAPAAKDHRFRQVLDSLARCNEYVQHLLDLAHPDEGSIRKFDMVEFVDGFARGVRPVLPSAITLSAELPQEPLAVLVNPRGLEPALLNLVLNARRAMRGRGTLRVRVARVGAAEVAVEVVDSGEGIPAANLARIFEPFFTTRPPGEGTGLGLAAVRRFVHAQGGRVEVESEIGKGSTFRLVFPLASERAGRATG